jgi:hypothetical protein
MAFLGPRAVLLTAVSSLALGLRSEGEEAMWAVGCEGGALRRRGGVVCGGRARLREAVAVEVDGERASRQGAGDGC